MSAEDVVVVFVASIDVVGGGRRGGGCGCGGSNFGSSSVGVN